MIQIKTFITKTTGIFLFLILSVALAVNVWKFSGYVNGKLQWLFIAGAIGLIALFCVFGGAFLNKIKRLLAFSDGWSVRTMALIMFIALAVSKIFLVFLLDNNVHNHDDMHHYLYFAEQIADNGVIADETLYARLFPYTVLYGMLLSPFFKLFGSDPKVATVLMSVLLTVTSVLLFDIIRPYAGKKKAFWGIMLYNFLPIGLFQSQVVVHETVLLFCSVLAFWLLQKALKKELSAPKRVVLLLLSALTIAIGTRLNLGGAVTIIAFVIYVLVKQLQTGFSLKKALNLPVTAACYALCTVLIFGLFSVAFSNIVATPADKKAREESIAANALPMGWNTYLGCNDSTGGVWNAEDWQTYSRYFSMTDPREAKDYQKKLVRERAESLCSDPPRLAKHLCNKAVEQWGVPLLGIVYGKGGNKINDFLLYAGNRAIYKGILALCYLSNILIYTIILFSYFKKRKKGGHAPVTPALQFKLMIVGTALALFPFEISNKYICHLHLLLMAVAIMSCARFIDNSERLRKKLFRSKHADRIDYNSK